ncbi:CoA-binding protein [Thermodesulfobacteriota bacterium]
MHLTNSDLEKFFNPKSIAFIGVSRSSSNFGGKSFLDKYLEAGYEGKLYPINPKAEEISGVKAWPSLESLPEIPDMALIAVAAPHVAEVIGACGQTGLRHAHILTSGFDESGTETGKKILEHLVETADYHDVLFIGPNCMGPYNPAPRLTAWGAIPGIPGPLGLILQSGAMTQRMTEYTASLGLGVSKAVSVGNGSVINGIDFLEAFGQDPSIKVIGIYLEGVPDGRRFLKVAQDVGQKKPVVLLKGGETSAGARTASSHTGAMAGDAVLWKAAAHQANMIRVEDINEWVDVLMACCRLSQPQSGGVFICCGGGGNSVIYGDICTRKGLNVPSLSKKTMKGLQKLAPEIGSITGNPLDMWKAYNKIDCLVDALDLIEHDPAIALTFVDRLITRKAYHIEDDPNPTPEMIEGLKKRRGKKPVIFVVDSEGGDSQLAHRGAVMRSIFGKGGYAAFPSISRAARAVSLLYRYYQRKEQLRAIS